MGIKICRSSNNKRKRKHTNTPGDRQIQLYEVVIAFVNELALSLYTLSNLIHSHSSPATATVVVFRTATILLFSRQRSVKVKLDDSLFVT